MVIIVILINKTVVNHMKYYLVIYLISQRYLGSFFFFLVFYHFVHPCIQPCVYSSVLFAAILFRHFNFFYSMIFFFLFLSISSSRGSSWPRDQTCVSCIGRWILYHWDTWEALFWNLPHIWSWKYYLFKIYFLIYNMRAIAPILYNPDRKNLVKWIPDT